MTVERGLVSISNNMAEERPPTNEEIVDLRARTSAFVSENGEGSNYLLVLKKAVVEKMKNYLTPSISTLLASINFFLW